MHLIWTLGTGSVIRNCGQTLEIPVLALLTFSLIVKIRKGPEVPNVRSVPKTKIYESTSFGPYVSDP